MMRSLFNILSTLEARFGPEVTVVILFGLAAFLGLLLGLSLMGIWGASRRRRLRREAEEEQELLQNLYNDQRLLCSGLQSENDSLKVRMANVDDREARHEREARQLNTELKAAQMSLQVKERELVEKLRLINDLEQNQNVQSSHLPMEKGKYISVGAVPGGRLVQGQVAGRGRVGEEARKDTSAVSQLSGAAGIAANAAEPPTLTRRVRGAKANSLVAAETDLIPDDQVIPTLPEAELTANVEAYDLSDLEDLVNEDL